jgi:phosphoribosylamine--glycine ligase
MGLRLLVVGSGAREHALVARLVAEDSVEAVDAAPGNPGIAALATCHPVAVDDLEGLVDLARGLAVDLVVVGPEAPLVTGLVDRLAVVGIAAFGPSAAAAAIEGSKGFAKDVLAAAGVATAAAVATRDRSEALAALARFGPPHVVKADGLAAGKGVVVTEDRDEAVAAIDAALVEGRFGTAGEAVVVEALLDGVERSLFAVCDGTDAVLLPPARDHKRALDGDRGPNTGGMGASSPVEGFGTEEAAPLLDTVVRPVLAELAGRGAPFRGLLYAGLVLTAEGPQVLEFNARFGDPETQVVLPRITSDLAQLLHASATGSVADVPLELADLAAVTVVLASGGYPEAYEVGRVITGVEEAEAMPGVAVLHAGTARDDAGRLVTAGGRVLSVTAVGPDVATARARAYAAADRIAFDGLQRREDVAAQ